jgi:hypothetical protein
MLWVLVCIGVGLDGLSGAGVLPNVLLIFGVFLGVLLLGWTVLPILIVVLGRLAGLDGLLGVGMLLTVLLPDVLLDLA